MDTGIERILYLQRTIGNQAVQRLVRSGALQAKLRIGQLGDVYEQEADRVTDTVMRMPEPGVQRQPIGEEEEKQIQTKPVIEQITPLVQKQVEEEEEEEEELRRQPIEEEEELQAKTTSGHLSYIQSTGGGGQPLPESVRNFYEPRFGADFSQVSVHTNTRAVESAKSINARAFTIGKNITFGASQYAPESHEGRHLLAHELTHVTQQGKGFSAVQMEGGKKRRKRKGVYIPYKIKVTSELSRDQFHVLAMKQVFGGVIKNVVWSNSKPSYTPDKSPYTLWVNTQLLSKHRGSVNAARGFDVDVKGGIKGAKGRAEAFHAGADSKDKSALMNEIDRRYYAAAGVKPGTKIKKGEKGRAALWCAIRDEVLFQHEYIANLPPQVKELIKFSIKGKDLTPADYEKLFAITMKIEKMPAGQVSDYASKVAGVTTDLDKFEASLDKYIAEMAERAKKGEEHEKIQTKLIGLEEVYKKYTLYKSLLTTSSMSAYAGLYGDSGAGVGLGTALVANKVRKELESQLKKHGFAGITEFESYIKKFEQAFELEAANIATDLLEKYAGKLYRESERYKNPTEIAALHRKLGGVRTQYREFEKNAKVWNEYMKARALRTHDYTSITSSEAETARKKAEEAKASAESQVKGMSGEHPIFQEGGLPLDKRIDKAALGKASESELGGLLQGYIQNRMKDIGEARAEIHKKPEVIYKMDKLLPVFYAKQGIRPGSIYYMIIRDKMRSDAILKLVKGIAVAIVAIALAVLTFGKAIPVIIAVGAGIAGAGLGVYMAYDEYLEYTQEKNLADVGFANDPSVVWLVIAVLGAALDMASAVKAVSALGKAAKALDAGGDLKAFTKVVRQLERKKTITAEIARAAEKAAVARKGFAEASAELTRVMAGKAYSFPGPLADPDVYKAVVKMARQAIKAKVYDAQKFIEELKLARVKAGLGDLTPEELAKAKQAWEEAKVLEAAKKARYEKLLKQIPDATKLDTLIVKAGDAAKLERLLKVFPKPKLETIFAQLKDTGHLVIMLDHVGADTGASMIRQWMAKGKFAKMNEFMERLAGGIGKELAETAAISRKSVIIDSQTVIALSKDAKALPLQDGEKLMVKYVKSLPPGTELRVGNVTIGEVGSKVVKVKGLPLEVARDSAAYRKVLAELERLNLGGSKGAADRALVADVFFAKTEPGVVPQFATADKNVFNKLATEAGIDLRHMGGKKLSELHPGGFDVSIAGQKLHVVTIEP